LIRYASEDEIEKGAKFKFTTRMKGYTAVLTILLGVLIGLLFLRTEVEATILRLPGQLYQHKGENISNIYTYKIINKTNEDFKNIHFKLKNIQGKITVVGKDNVSIKRQGMAEGTLFVEINQYILEHDKTPIKIEVYEGNKKIETAQTNFLSPRTFD
jgi:polyferredoxin